MCLYCRMSLTVHLVCNINKKLASTKVRMMNCCQCEVTARKSISRLLLKPSKFTMLIAQNSEHTRQ